MSAIRKMATPCRSLLCNSPRTHLIAAVNYSTSKRKKPSILSMFVTWDASKWADLPHTIRKLYEMDAGKILEVTNVKQLQLLYQDQQFRQERYDALGPDIALATFIVHRGGKVKFANYKNWSTKSSNRALAVPSKKVEGFILEGVNASGMSLLSVAIDNFANIEHLSYLNLSEVEHLNDWTLARLGRLSGCLEFLDISNNPKVTDEGLAALHKLRNLKCLNISKCTGIKTPGIVCSYLTELIPDLTVLGLDNVSDEGELGLFERECKERRYLNIGDQLDGEGNIRDVKQVEFTTDELDFGDSVTDTDEEPVKKVEREHLKEAASG